MVVIATAYYSKEFKKEYQINGFNYWIVFFWKNKKSNLPSTDLQRCFFNDTDSIQSSLYLIVNKG